MRVLILRGDDRSRYLKDIFTDNGIYAHYIDYKGSMPSNQDYNIMILPVPIFDTTPYMQILDNCDSAMIFYASSNTIIEDNLGTYGCINLMDDECYVGENARLTAEAALSIAISNGSISLNGAKCLICGFGRIGINLMRMLAVLGAQTTIATGSTSNIKTLMALGLDYIFYDQINNDLDNYDFIFNTVPANIFSTKTISEFKGIYYELASSPYGFDSNLIGFEDNTRVLCSKLPGKYFPYSSAMIIYNAVLKHTRGVDICI